MAQLFSRLSHEPEACADALRSAAPGSEVIIDLETSGLGRRHRIVSVGVLVESELYILFTGSIERSVVPLNISSSQLASALAPLSDRTDLVCVFHNAIFDLGFLKRAGIEVNCQIWDTFKLALLLDSDRSRKEVRRVNRQHGEIPNYRLKDLVLLELGVNAPHFPGAAATLDYRPHVRYLASDCVITRLLLVHLKERLRPADLHYYRHYVSPVTPILVEMGCCGAHADVNFIRTECQRLQSLMRQLSQEHLNRFALRLDAGDFALRGHIYFKAGGLRCFLPKSHWVKVGGRRLPPLKYETLDALRQESPRGSRRHESLSLVVDYLLLRGLLIRLASLREKYVDQIDGVIYATLDDRQASGRISATNPNLQGIANNVAKGGKRQLVSESMAGIEVRSRNAICARPGCQLVSFDINRADIASLAHVSDSLRETGAELIQRLEQERIRELQPAIGPYLERMWAYYRPENRKSILCPACRAVQQARRQLDRQQVRCASCGHEFTIAGRAPYFDPGMPSRLAEDFAKTREDFYAIATRRTLGRDPRDKAERNALKQTILGLVNSMSGHGLANRLDVDLKTARFYIEQFAKAYPKEFAYIELMHHAVAITGCSESFGGRRRRVTPHYLMVTEPEVELLLSYRGADKLWARVVPLQPGRHTLTCWVKSVVDAKYGSPREGQEIYHHRDGRISQAPYRFFDDAGLVFRLPVRNISWRIIRRVRTAREECSYAGFDTTRRQLTNHIFQGSTADIARLMMVRTQLLCQEFGARLVLQIHDELLFEAPGDHCKFMKFVRSAARILEQPPTPDFSVPITVGPKIGRRFGDLRELERWEYASPWPVRLWKIFARQVRLWFRNWRRRAK